MRPSRAGSGCRAMNLFFRRLVNYVDSVYITGYKNNTVLPSPTDSSQLPTTEIFSGEVFWQTPDTGSLHSAAHRFAMIYSGRDDRVRRVSGSASGTAAGFLARVVVITITLTRTRSVPSRVRGPTASP